MPHRACREVCTRLRPLLSVGAWAQDEDSVKVSNRTDVVSCFSRLIPVTFEDSKGKTYYRLFMVTSIIGKSGVDVLACINRITNPNDYSSDSDKRRALSRQTLWNSIWLEEVSILQRHGTGTDESSHVQVRSHADFDNDFDAQHPYMYCNEMMIFKKIECMIMSEQARLVRAHDSMSELQFSEIEIFGVPCPRERAEHIQFQKSCQVYCDRIREFRADFRVASDHFISQLKTTGAAPEVVYNLRHVPGLVLNTEEVTHTYDLLYGHMETPMTLQWAPLNALNFSEEWEKFDVGMLPLTTRVLVLDFQQGTVEMNESVLSEADKLPSVEINRWNTYYCTQRDPLLEYVRPGCYSMWYKGIRHKLLSMQNEGLEGRCSDPQSPLSTYAVSRQVVDRMRTYISQAARWHMAQTEIGEYRSDCLQGGGKLLKAYRERLPALTRSMLQTYGRGANAHVSCALPLLSQMRHAFYECCLGLNKYASMTYANMELFVQIFTSDILWHFGHNESWTTFCQCIQVVPMKGNFEHSIMRSGKNNTTTARLVAKPNSSGVDAIVSWWYNLMMRLPENVNAGLGDLCLTMVGTHRTTPVALERQSKVRIVQDRIEGEPSAQVRFRAQKMTEERHLDKRNLSSKIQMLPRHKNASDDAGVNVTDVDETGRRQNERWVDIGGFVFLLCATNGRSACEEESECWNTLSSSQLWMSTGRSVVRKRRFNTLEDHQVVASSKTTTSIDDMQLKQELAVPMCVLPKVTAQLVALMNHFGLTAVEVDTLCRSLDSWFCYMFIEFFECFCSKTVLSIRRRLDGMQSRTVAESAMSRLTAELCLSVTFEEALQSTCLALTYHALDPVDVCVYIDDGLRQCMDHPFLVMHHIIATELLQFPMVNFDWLCGILNRGHATDAERDSMHGRRLLAFLRECLQGDRLLLPDDAAAGTTSGMDFAAPAAAPVPESSRDTKRVPYVSMPGGSSDEFLRVHTKSTSTSVQVISKALRKSAHIAQLHRVAGLPMDDDMMFIALRDYASKIFDLSAFMCVTGSLSAARLFSCFGLHNDMPRCFNEHTLQSDSAPMGYFSARSAGQQDTRHVSFGVHIVAGLLVSAFLGDDMQANSTCDAVASGAIMRKILHQAPRGLLAPTGSRYLRKSFSGTVVKYDVLDVADGRVRDGHYNRSVAYFTRPLHDDAFSKEQVSQYMPCNVYKTYWPEDVLHMSHVLAALQYFDMQHLGMIPVDLVRPHYNLLYGVHYPVLRYREPEFAYVPGCDLSVCAAHGYIRTMQCPERNVPVFQLFAAYHDSEGRTAPDDVEPLVDHFAQGVSCDMAELYTRYLSELQLVVAPLVNRHGAVVYDAERTRFGVIVPLCSGAHGTGEQSDSPRRPDRGADGYHSFLHPARVSYSVQFQGEIDPEWVHVLQVERMLLPIAKRLLVRLTVLRRYARDADVIPPRVLDMDPQSTYVHAYLRYVQDAPSTMDEFSCMVVCVQKATAAAADVHYHTVSVPVGLCSGNSDILLAEQQSALSGVRVLHAL